MKVQIYEKIDKYNKAYWVAYNKKNEFINNSVSILSANDCEQKVRFLCSRPKPKLIKEFEI